MTRDREEVELDLTDLKFVHHLRSLQDLADGRSIAEVPPVTVEIDPTNVCNSNCWWCSTAETRRRDPVGLSKEDVDRVLTQAAGLGAQSVVFKGGGDPTVKPYLREAVSYAAELGLKVGINTNGVKLDDQLQQALIDHGSWIRFSLDACNREMYRNIHRRDDFETVNSNISSLIQKRNRKEDSMLVIGLNFCIDQYNIDAPESMLEYSNNIGADYASFRPAYHEIVDDEEGKQTLQELRPRIVQTLGTIDSLASRYRELVVRTGNIRNGQAEVSDPGSCLATALTAIITATGDVAACCDLRGHPIYSFGNIHASDLETIWRSMRRAEVFERTSRRECAKFCSHAYGRYNQVIDFLRRRPDAEFM